MSVVEEYEVFKNDNDALAFFFYRQPVLDNNNPEGPFVFTVSGSTIFAGTKEHYIVLEGVNDEVIATAKERGNIMLMEFENQQPMRATPCYFIEGF